MQLFVPLTKRIPFVLLEEDIVLYEHFLLFLLLLMEFETPIWTTHCN